MRKYLAIALKMMGFLAAAAALYIVWLLIALRLAQSTAWPEPGNYNVIIQGRVEAPILEMAAEEDHGR